MRVHRVAAAQQAVSLGPSQSGEALWVEPLSRREQEVLGLVVQAAGTREIAQQLGISPRTVECHLGNVYGKLGLRGRMEAMLWAMRQALEQA